jgi:hypothetical protein
MKDDLPVPEPIIGDVLPEHSLEKEWATFCREFPRLREAGHLGRWALIKGEELVGVYDTDDDALDAGYERFGLGLFLIQPITTEERPVRTVWSRLCPP